MDFVSDAIIITDTNLNVISWNRAAEAIYGWPKSETIGKIVSNIIRAQNLTQPASELLEILVSTGKWEGEQIHTHKNGYPIHVMASVSCIYAEGKEVKGYVAVNRNITDQKNIQKVLEDSLNQHNALRDKITQISTYFINLYAKDIDEGIEYALKQVCDFAYLDRAYVFLYTDEGTRMSNIHEYCQKGVTSLKKLQQNIEVDAFPWFARELQEKYLVNIPNVTKMPEEAVIEKNFYITTGVNSMLAVPLLREGKLLGFVGFDAMSSQRNWSQDTISLFQIVADIIINALERKNWEIRLKEARDSLEQEVEKRTAELFHSNELLENFAYMASHDLREPLRMVVNYLQLLERSLYNTLGESEKDYIHYAIDGAMRMRKLLEGMLAYSRVKTHSQPFSLVNMSKVMEDVCANLDLVISDTKADVTCRNLPQVYADAEQMLQLLQNLVGNALKFQPENQIPQVEVWGEEGEDHFTFAVKDNGIGMEPQYKERIFQIFNRLHARDKYPGSGIGLAICKEIVTHHHGKIWVESVLDQGTTFFFTLPK
ncbi:MAG: ATP-binding protein [Bacteroidia bacterium]|nr:ATP-binding protein [Bacteroidia bacterium]